MSDTSGASGYMILPNAASEAERIAFHFERAFANARGMTPVKVLKVYKNDGTSKKTQGAVEPAGFVDVQPLISQVDGAGNKVDHGTIFHLPYLRMAGGNAAHIMDPVVGDVGIIQAGDRDMSSFKDAFAGGSSASTYTPNSRRRHDLADSVYIGTILTKTPKQYTTYGADGSVKHGDAAGSTSVLDGQGNLVHTANNGNATVQAPQQNATVSAGQTAQLKGNVADVTGSTTVNIGAGTTINISSPNVAFSGGGGVGTPTVTGLPAGLISLNVQVFTSSGTYTPTAGMVFCIIECVGGGGAGGGVVGGVSACIGGGGGGSGAYCRGVATAATIGASQSVTIGGGGTGSSGANGGNGGTTSVGSLISAPGGGGGQVNNPNTSFGGPGAAGSGGSGSLSGAYLPGIAGFYGSVSFNNLPSVTGLIAMGGAGAPSAFGTGAAGIISGGTANPGTTGGSYGSGGSGAAVVGSATNNAGGNGTSGAVIITEFLT